MSQIVNAQSLIIKKTTPSYPNVERVRVVHSDYENTAFLDRSLADLNLFEKSGFSADLEMEGINMLFLIQVICCSAPCPLSHPAFAILFTGSLNRSQL